MKTYQFTFTNKETYLEFRSVWKKEYAELTLKIRAQKQEIKSANRLFNPVENDYQLHNEQYSYGRRPTPENHIDLKPYWAKIWVLGDACRDYLRSKEKAKENLEILSQAKKKKKKQYENRLTPNHL